MLSVKSKRLLRASLIVMNAALLMTFAIYRRSLFSHQIVPGDILRQIQAGTYRVADAAPLLSGQLLGGENTPPRENATLVTVCRNSDLAGLLQTIQSYEDRFNKQFHYDWVFLNDEEFTDHFKNYTSLLVSGKTHYGKIPPEMWGYPEWINQTYAAEIRTQMAGEGVLYGDSEAYRHMCRFQSGFFYRHELMQKYKYYWRVDADTKIFCDIDYDVFKFMRDNDKKYGFVIALHEFPQTIRTLWYNTVEFLKRDKAVIHESSLSPFISTDLGHTYSLCHFWSNFEIADADFWRSQVYESYFDYLDKIGGFYYERWGDAPIHTIAVSLFLDRNQIHYFDDIGYYHEPFYRVPDNFVERQLACSLVPEKSTDFICLDFYKQLSQL